MKRLLAGAIILALGLLFMTTPTAGRTPGPAPQLLETKPITSGANLIKYHWETDSGPVKIHMFEIDLTNPYVQIEVIPGGGKLTQRLNVSAMAKNTGAVAAINGDYYNMSAEGAPLGPMIMAERLVSSPARLENIYSLGITTDRQAFIDRFTFQGYVKAPSGQSFDLAGLNKTIYWEEPHGTHSHVNKLHLYNDLWGGKTRGHDTYTTPTEMLIKDGRVIEIVAGRYFDHSVPEGMKILRGHGEAALFIVSNFQPGDWVDINYVIEPNKDWSMVIGGHALLVDQGNPIPYMRQLSSSTTPRTRTAAGISQDRKTLYLVGVERTLPSSVGLSLDNLTNFFQHIGVWQALNLDGGGSTTMVSRPLGEFTTKRVFEPLQPQERLIVNAIGIYSQAPKGDLQGLLIAGEQILLVNEKAQYTLKGYDQHYNPIAVDQLSVNWQRPEQLTILDEHKFIAITPGTAELRATVGTVEMQKTIQVIGKDELSTMTLTQMPGPNLPGSQTQLQLRAITNTGATKKVAPDLVEWQIHGFKGQVSPEGVLMIQDVMNNALGYVVARYKGFSAPLVLQFQKEQQVLPLNTVQGLAFQKYPEEVTGSLTSVSDPANPAGQVIQLAYDFKGGQGTTAAYVSFGQGIPVDTTAEKIAVSVSSDNPNQWIRAELIDGEGNTHRRDLSPMDSRTGWQTVQVNIQDLPQPLALKFIYVVATAEQRNNQNLQGDILLKNLRFVYGPKEPKEIEQPHLELFLGKTVLLIDGSKTQMDAAPHMVNGRTLVPVRFVAEALGANVLWDGATKNATVIRNRQWIDLWAEQATMVVDGQVKLLDVAPEIINNRTMLPLRALAESMNISVHWDRLTQKITLIPNSP